MNKQVVVKMDDLVMRESLRWRLLHTLNNAAPYSTSEVLLRDVMSSIYGEVSKNILRKELVYLENKQLIAIERTPRGLWFADILPDGTDIAEYVIESPKGIARPPKYWE